MLLIIDLDNGRLLDAYLQQLTALSFRFRSDAAIEIMFRKGGVYVDPADTGLIFLIKTSGKFEEDPPLVLCDTFAKTGTGETAKWTGYAPIYGAAIEARLVADGNPDNDVSAFTAMAAVAFQIDGAIKPTELPYLTATISNSLYAGTESPPALPPPNAQSPSFLPGVTGLTGGDATDLDGQPTDGVAVPRLYEIVVGGVWYAYYLRTKTGGDVVDGTSVIEPVDYDADTNNKVFVVLGAFAIAGIAGLQAALDANISTAAVVTTTPGWNSTVVTLTGGGATALDGVNGVLDGSTVFTLGRLFFLNITGSGLKAVILKAGTQATDGVSFVRPANYNASTFAYVFNIIL